jgi:RimJ/RimL family protein N-acetyltransferase
VTGIRRQTYETERLQLRPLAMSDGDALHALQCDGEMMRYFGGPYRREQTDTWLEWHVAIWEQEGYSHWAAELKEAGIFVGWIGLTKVWEPEEMLPAVEVGWFVDRRYWGNGLATEGGRRSLTFGFEELGLDRIIARYDPENYASGKVMEKLGMNHVCDMSRSNAEGLARIYEIRAEVTEGDFEPSDP